MNVDEIRAIEDLPPLPKPTDPSDYDGTDYTPLQIQVAAARGIKKIIGEGTGGQGGTGGVETNPEAVPQAPAPMRPQPVPSPNGNGRPQRG